jgi:hypothetical protein
MFATATKMFHTETPHGVQNEESSSGTSEASYHSKPKESPGAPLGSGEQTRTSPECNVEKLTRKDSYKIGLWKYAVVVFTVAVAAGVVVGTYRLLSDAEQDAFDGAVRAD